MIGFEEYRLANGLQLLVHEDHSSPVVCVNLLYKVGSRNEHPERTGFAHLFEHLMFGGSRNIPSFDEPLQRAGGDNNAFTNTDITNYYITVPSANVETAFWLESDRMLSLSFDPEVLEVQRKVVIEEFKQRYLNQPYGDVWLKLRPLAYQVHPYQWATIGKEISHIEQATMADVRAFFETHYHPGNAVLVVAGDITPQRALELTQKWFGEIAGKAPSTQHIPAEPTQKAARHLEIRAEVPDNALYKVYHMSDRLSPNYHADDLLSDLLGRGTSSMLHERLVKRQPIFTGISASVSGSYDPGLLVISGKLCDGVDIRRADEAVEACLQEIQRDINPNEVQKVKNQSESTTIFAEVDLLNRAMGLAYAAFLGDPHRVNTEIDLIRSITPNQLLARAGTVLRPENCTTLYYLKKD